MSAFRLNSRLANDTKPVCTLPLCEVLLMDDQRFPWLILVPRRPEVTEFLQLTAADQQQLWQEITQCSSVLMAITDADKLNTAALGNVVSQLHWHVVARNQDDAAWPGPVWGHGQAQPYDKAKAQALINALNIRLA